MSVTAPPVLALLTFPSDAAEHDTVRHSVGSIQTTRVHGLVQNYVPAKVPNVKLVTNRWRASAEYLRANVDDLLLRVMLGFDTKRGRVEFTPTQRMAILEAAVLLPEKVYATAHIGSDAVCNFVGSGRRPSKCKGPFHASAQVGAQTMAPAQMNVNIVSVAAKPAAASAP